MTVYYSDDAVQVTSESLEVNGTVFPLAELARVWHRRGPRSWRVLAGRSALGLALVVPLATAVIGVFLAVRLDLSTVNTVTLVLGAILFGLAVGPLADFILERVDRSYARGSRRHEIWALWRGTAVLLIVTGDALRFGQIYRALQRAIETDRDGGRANWPAR